LCGLTEQFAIRNCGQNWKLIHLGLQAPQFIDEENKKHLSIFKSAPEGVGKEKANCELRIGDDCLALKYLMELSAEYFSLIGVEENV